MNWDRYLPGRNEFNRQFVFSLAHDRHNPAPLVIRGVFEVTSRRRCPMTSRCTRT